jgi:hypothetical protein
MIMNPELYEKKPALSDYDESEAEAENAPVSSPKVTGNLSPSTKQPASSAIAMQTFALNFSNMYLSTFAEKDPFSLNP